MPVWDRLIVEASNLVLKNPKIVSKPVQNTRIHGQFFHESILFRTAVLEELERQRAAKQKQVDDLQKSVDNSEQVIQDIQRKYEAQILKEKLEDQARIQCYYLYVSPSFTSCYQSASFVQYLPGEMKVFTWGQFGDSESADWAYQYYVLALNSEVGNDPNFRPIGLGVPYTFGWILGWTLTAVLNKMDSWKNWP